MLARLLDCLPRAGRSALQTLRRRLAAATRPAAPAALAGALADLARSEGELIAENALPRQQLVVLQRSVKLPHCRPADRTLLPLLASRVGARRQAVLIVQPATLLRRHRRLFRHAWRRTSRSPAAAQKPKGPTEAIARIREMARAMPRWGAGRIRGERRNLAHAIRACDVLPVTGVFLRPRYARVVIALGWRRAAPAGVARCLTDARVARQRREARPRERRPRWLIRDNDRKCCRAFVGVAAASDIAVVRTASRAQDECGLRAVPGQHPAGVPEPPAGPERGAPAPHPAGVRGVRQPGATTPGQRAGRPRCPRSARSSSQGAPSAAIPVLGGPRHG